MTTPFDPNTDAIEAGPLPISDPLPRAEAADRIWSVVEPMGETGLRGADIRELASLKRGQFENGKVQIREHKAAEEGKSFVWDGDVYVTTTDPGRCAKALALRLRSIDRQLNRMYESTCRPLDDEIILNHPALRYLRGQISAMRDNLEVLRKTGYSSTSKLIPGNSTTPR